MTTILKKAENIMFKPAKDFTINQKMLDDHWLKCRFITLNLDGCPDCLRLSTIVVNEDEKT
jgi:hypothetical protein